MNNLKARFGRVNINSPMGIPIRGYYKPRFAEAILDDLEINALALQTVLRDISPCRIPTMKADMR